jgi:hypothetical protein
VTWWQGAQPSAEANNAEEITGNPWGDYETTEGGEGEQISHLVGVLLVMISVRKAYFF